MTSHGLEITLWIEVINSLLYFCRIFKNRSIAADADSCQIKGLTDAMTDNGGDLKAPIIQPLTSSTFRQRIDRSAEP